jgi:hypothetical protein
MQANGSGARQPQRLALLLLLLSAIVLLVAHALRFRILFDGNCPDDAYISFRYADNLMQGEGLVFNPGEQRVEGFSNFLWVLLLAPVAAVFADLTLPAQFLGLLCAAATLVVAVAALRDRFQVRTLLPTAFLLLLLAGSGYYAAWSVGGLEGGIFGLLLLTAWWLYSRELESETGRFPLSAFFFALVALVRPEGVLIAAGIGLFHLAWVGVSRPRPAMRRLLLFPLLLMGLVLAYEAWRFQYYGPNLFPNSVRAKVGSTWNQVARGLHYSTTHFLVPYFPLLLTLASGRAVWRRPASVVGLLLFLGYLLFVALVGGDWSRGRFYAPILPLGTVLFVAAFARAPRWQRLRSARARPILLGVAGVYLLACFVITSPLREASDWSLWTRGDAERIAIGEWLRETAPPDALLGVMAAGQIPYYSKLRTHDMLGLNDPRIAGMEVSRLGRGTPGHEKFDPTYTLGEVRPDVIVGGDRMIYYRRHPLFQRDYQLVSHFWEHHQVAVRRDFLPRLRTPR